MKKINIALLFITLICSFVTIIGEVDRGIVIVLKDSSIVLTASLPFIVNKFFKGKLNDEVIFVWLIFIFLAHYMGVTLEMYNKWPGFDKVVHTFSGILTAYVGMLFLPKGSKIGFSILFIVCFSAMCAFMWETFEFVCNLLVGGDAQRVAATGVTDTMLDMIVAFIGACLFSVFYYVRMKKINVKKKYI